VLRRSLLAVGVLIAASASLAAGAAAQVQAAPNASPAGAPALPFNTQAQIVSGNIVDADDSGAAKTDGLAVRATTDKPLAKNYDASLVGIAIVPPGLQIMVAHHASAALIEAIKAEADGMPVSIRVVSHSAAQLAAVQARIGADIPYLAARGIDVTAWGQDPSSDTVSVLLADYSPAAARAIVARYGSAWVSVDPTSGAASAADDRADDSPPWYGGDQIEHHYGGGTSYCSSGFALTILGAAYVPTAAHCLESNYANDFYNTDGNEVGSIWGYNNSEDTVIINAAAVLPDIWSDPNSTAREVVKVAPNDPQYGLICTDGYATREVCDVEIETTDTNVVYTVNGVSTEVYGVVYACQTAGDAAFSSGDSGGPVETTLGSSEATARGEILASNTDAPNASCGWYLPERTIESDWDASTVLG